MGQRYCGVAAATCQRAPLAASWSCWSRCPRSPRWLRRSRWEAVGTCCWDTLQSAAEACLVEKPSAWRWPSARASACLHRRRRRSRAACSSRRQRQRRRPPYWRRGAAGGGAAPAGRAGSRGTHSRPSLRQRLHFSVKRVPQATLQRDTICTRACAAGRRPSSTQAQPAAARTAARRRTPSWKPCNAYMRAGSKGLSSAITDDTSPMVSSPAALWAPPPVAAATALEPIHDSFCGSAEGEAADGTAKAAADLSLSSSSFGDGIIVVLRDSGGVPDCVSTSCSACS